MDLRSFPLLQPFSSLFSHYLLILTSFPPSALQFVCKKYQLYLVFLARCLFSFSPCFVFSLSSTPEYHITSTVLLLPLGSPTPNRRPPELNKTAGTYIQHPLYSVYTTKYRKECEESHKPSQSNEQETQSEWLAPRSP